MGRKWGAIFVIVIVILSACSQALPKKQGPVGPNNKDSREIKLPKINHIVVVVEENHSQQVIQGNSNAPFMNSMMKQGTNFTNYFALEHPSQPNYLDLFSGSNQGVTNDKVPKAKFSTPNLASELIDKNYSFAGYSEDLPSVGFDGASTRPGGYARKHNPWVNFINVPKEDNQPFGNFPTDFNQLPTVSFVIPNLQHDMHDGTIKEADEWLKEHLGEYVRWAKTNNSLLIVTWDEDDFSQNNKIPTFIVGSAVKIGPYQEEVNHFNLLRTIEEIFGLAHAGNSNYVKPIMNIWE